MKDRKIFPRPLGQTGMMVSQVGLGCWQLGGDFGPISEEKAKEILEKAVEDGVTFFDTADVYGDGQSERYLGDVLSRIAPDAIIATKYGRAQGVYPDNYTRDNLRDSVRRSQDRLQRNTLDLLQLHCVPPAVLQQGDVFDWLRELKQDGEIKAFGASVETIAEAKLCLQQADLSSLQIIFNLMRQRPLKALFDEAREKQVGIIVRLPLASGMLSGKFDKDTVFDKSDHRHFNKDGEAFSVGETFSGIEFETGLKLVETLKTDFKPLSVNMAQFAMRWILDHGAVTTIIPGASSTLQVTQNVDVSEMPKLGQKLHDELYQFYVDKIEPAIRCEI